jgi:hypothetical protein
MKPDGALEIDASPILKAEPDVWWGEPGIDALLWADPTPYAPPVGRDPVSPALVMAEAVL